MSKVYQKTIPDGKNAAEGKLGGFTLIELLVVVLIIGILAAVALPRYEQAVIKSRFMSFMPTVRAIINAQEVYYMANGKYAFNLSDLDVQIPFGCQARVAGAPNEILCGSDWLLDSVSANLQSQGYLRICYCPGSNANGSNSCPQASDSTLMFYYSQHADKGGQIVCYGRTAKGRKLCKTFEGIFN